MANILVVTNSAVYTPSATPTIPESLPGVTSLSITVAGNIYVRDIMTVNTSDTTINLGGLSSPFGVASFKNLDPTNTINIKVAAAGTIIASLLPGECWTWRLGSGISAPVAIASGAACLMSYAILPP